MQTAQANTNVTNRASGSAAMDRETTMTNTLQETDRKCPQCGGTLEFDPSTGGLKCPYCDYTEAIRHEEEAKESGTIDDEGRFVATEHAYTGKEDTATTDWGTATKTVICKSCGAEIMYDANAIANVCPYCGSTQVMEAGDQKEKIMAPGGVVTFDVDQRRAAELFKTWIGHKFFCPKLAKESAEPDKFHGVYVPYWTFDAEASGDYTGEYGINRTVKKDDGKTEIVTDWYGCSGEIEHFFDDVLVTASDRYDTMMLQSVEPYRTDEVKPYKPQYLAGFMAERYTLKLTDAWPKAQSIMDEEMHELAEDDIRDQHNPDDVRSVSIEAKYADVTYKYLLLPVWISCFRYQDKIYRFMVNGQTGKVSGKTPISWIKVALTTIAVIAIFVLLYYLLGD